MNGTLVLQNGQAIIGMSDIGFFVPEYTLFTTKPCPDVCALTDAGRRIELFRYEAVMVYPPGTPQTTFTEKMRQEFMAIQERAFVSQTCPSGFGRKLFEPCGLANCHGWTFVQGQYGILDSAVWTILNDHRYAEVAEPCEGDLALLAVENDVQHTGIVRRPAGGELLIESKWGPFGVYLHSTTHHPYLGRFRYFRSQRPDHRLALERLS